MKFALYNPPKLPGEKAMTLAAYRPNQDLLKKGEHLASAIIRDGTILGGHLAPVSFDYLGNMSANGALKGRWLCLSANVEEGGKSWGLFQQESDA